jgi:hypothetical protein
MLPRHTHPHPRAYTLLNITDYETGVIARMYADGSQSSGYNAAVIARAGFRIAALAEDAAGELYIIKYGEGAQIYALPNPPGTVGTTSSATGPAAPPVVAPPVVAPPVVAPVPGAGGGNAVAPVVPAAPVATATGGGSVVPGSVSVPTEGGGANANTVSTCRFSISYRRDIVLCACAAAASVAVPVLQVRFSTVSALHVSL